MPGRSGTTRRKDGNHESVMEALRAASMRPHSTSALGCGFPDIVVGFRGVNVMLEVKDGDKPPSGRVLTAEEVKFHDTWAGQIAIVNSPEEAVIAVVEHCKRMGVV